MEEQENVIIRNLGVRKVLAEYGDAVTVRKLSAATGLIELHADRPEQSQNVWIDHCDVSSDRDHNKDYYDGLVDVSAPVSGEKL